MFTLVPSSVKYHPLQQQVHVVCKHPCPQIGVCRSTCLVHKLTPIYFIRNLREQAVHEMFETVHVHNRTARKAYPPSVFVSSCPPVWIGAKYPTGLPPLHYKLSSVLLGCTTSTSCTMCVEVLDPAVELARPSWVVSCTEIQKHVYIRV